MQRRMTLCIKCLNMVRDAYDVKVNKPMSEKGKCDFCGYPGIYGYEVIVSGKGTTDEERDSSYPSAEVP